MDPSSSLLFTFVIFKHKYFTEMNCWLQQDSNSDRRNPHGLGKVPVTFNFGLVSNNHLEKVKAFKACIMQSKVPVSRVIC